MANTGSHSMCLSEVQVGLPLPPVGDRMHSLIPPALAVNNLGHVDIRVTHVVPHMLSRTCCPGLSPALLRPCSGLAPSRSIGLECIVRKTVRKLRKDPLLLESAESGSPQKLFANIRGQIGFRVCTYDVCHRRAYACVHRGCKIGVDLARMRAALHRCHTRDLSALIDIASRDYEEVGIRGN
jgi:hypothetical protein